MLFRNLISQTVILMPRFGHATTYTIFRIAAVSLFNQKQVSKPTASLIQQTGTHSAQAHTTISASIHPEVLHWIVRACMHT